MVFEDHFHEVSPDFVSRVYEAIDYDPTRPSDKRLRDFYIASLFTRCSGDNLRVNVSRGGCVVPVYVSKT